MVMERDVVLIGLDEKGRVVDVGIYDDETAMRKHAHKNTRDGCRYSVWTPHLNESIAAPTVTGLSSLTPWK